MNFNILGHYIVSPKFSYKGMLLHVYCLIILDNLLQLLQYILFINTFCGLQYFENVVICKNLKKNKNLHHTIYNMMDENFNLFCCKDFYSINFSSLGCFHCCFYIFIQNVELSTCMLHLSCRHQSVCIMR